MIPSSICTSATGILRSGNSETGAHRPSVSLTEVGVHGSMNPCEFSNLRFRFTFPIITKEACA